MNTSKICAIIFGVCALAAWTALAILFHKWWLIFFDLFFLPYDYF